MAGRPIQRNVNERKAIPGARNSCAIMTPRPIDQNAIRIPQKSGLPPCLYSPISARDANAIERYVGHIVAQLAKRTASNALLVAAHEPEKADPRLSISIRNTSGSRGRAWTGHMIPHRTYSIPFFWVTFKGLNAQT